MNKKCVVCGKVFDSKNGIVTCSHECFLIRKQHYDARSNYVRYGGERRKIKCPICGKVFEVNKKHLVYCSSSCREIATKSKKKEYFKKYYNLNKVKVIENVKKNKQKR